MESILGCELYSVCLFLVYEINCGKTSVELLCMDGKICTLEASDVSHVIGV